MILKLLTEHQLEFLSLKEGCRGSSESTLVKMPHCWKSHVTAQLEYCIKKIMETVPSSLTHAPTVPDQDPDEHTRMFSPDNM